MVKKKVSKQPDRRAIFIRELAVYLVGDQAHIKPEAKAWASLRGYTPLFGYPTVDEAEATLTKFLGPGT